MVVARRSDRGGEYWPAREIDDIALRIAQEPLDLFRRYFSAYARDQAYCAFSPAMRQSRARMKRPAPDALTHLRHAVSRVCKPSGQARAGLIEM